MGTRAHSTNYIDTFIVIAADSRVTQGMEPKLRATPTVAQLMFGMVHPHPYRYTSDDVLFAVFAERKGIAARRRAAARVEFFSKPQACMRASPLSKSHGWGIHHDAQARVALYGAQTARYAAFVADRCDADGRPLVIKTAMRSRRSP